MKSITKLCWTAIALPSAITPVISLTSCGNKQPEPEQPEAEFRVSYIRLKDCYSAEMELVWTNTNIQFELSNFSFDYDHHTRLSSVVVLSETTRSKVFQINLVDPVVTKGVDCCFMFHYKNLESSQEFDYVFNDLMLAIPAEVSSKIFLVSQVQRSDSEVIECSRSDACFQQNVRYQMCLNGTSFRSSDFDLTRNNVIIDAKFDYNGNRFNAEDFPGKINYFKYGSKDLQKDIDYEVITWNPTGFCFRVKNQVIPLLINDIYNYFVIDFVFQHAEWQEVKLSFIIRADSLN